MVMTLQNYETNKDKFGKYSYHIHHIRENIKIFFLKFPSTLSDQSSTFTIDNVFSGEKENTTPIALMV